ncbi:hypothetical protein [Vibrio rumoiensis]|uniref:DNA gyrase subunit B n=1 Tax=Vibrio rumoiensis 1S-45 TaxID=1188252 RepID=A0A1E5E234_9VIBR|nr:hypothetical protein [Vibrio rumoiensis]OEF25451.1 DNA gyrase subunit B [Vibrio rumoiensis 1S-45]
MRALTALSALLLLAYPLAVYYGLSRWGIGVIGGVFAVLFILRIVAGSNTKLKELKYIAWLSGGAGITLTLLATLFREHGWFTFYPVIVSTLMFVLFFSSLWQKQTLIERLARLQDPNLPQSGVQYTRTVTKVWCGYFVINGSIALYTCFLPLSIWTLYNGLISYLLAGCLFAIEWLVRLRVQKKSNLK